MQRETPVERTKKIIGREEIRIVDSYDNFRWNLLRGIAHLENRIFRFVNDLLLDFQIIEIEHKTPVEIAFSRQRAGSERNEGVLVRRSMMTHR